MRFPKPVHSPYFELVVHSNVHVHTVNSYFKDVANEAKNVTAFRLWIPE